MNTNNPSTPKIQIYLAVILGLALTFVIGFLISSSLAGHYDSFAQCLSQKGVKFYGAFWCPHCADQKELLGNSMRYINYVECSNPDLSRTKICIDSEIVTYPTWILANGTRYTAVLPLKNLSKISGCHLK